MSISLPAFEFLQPVSIEEAVGLLAANAGAMVIAGGTDLLPNIKRRQVAPTVVVGLGAMDEMRAITVDADGGVTIGALTTLDDLAQAPAIPAALGEAAASVASPQIRNVATVGGNLCADTRCGYINQTEPWRLASGFCLKAGGDVCWVAPKGEVCVAVSSSDLAPVIVALDSTVTLIGPDGVRDLQAADLYRADGLDHLGRATDEILTSVSIPPRPRWSSTYMKLRRRASIDFSMFGVAAAVERDPDGTVTDARLVLGAVAPAPIRVRAAEERIVGNRLDEETIAAAAAEAARPVRPYDNVDLGSRYRKWMAPVFVARALRRLS